jgi:hypothetical protein
MADADRALGLNDRMLRDVGLWRDRHGRIRAIDGSD